MAFDEQRNVKQLFGNLDLVDERKDQTSVQLATNHRKIANYYNTRV